VEWLQQKFNFTTVVFMSLNIELSPRSFSDKELLADISLVCAADNRYSMQLAVVLCSVLSNLPSSKKLNAYIIDGGISPENKHKISQTLSVNNCQISWLSPEKSFSHLRADGHFSIAAYYRLLIPELLPDLDKVIYLDSDLMVDADISNLWGIDISDHYLAAVEDQSLPNIQSAIPQYKDFGFSGEESYFNSGVLLMNLNLWRKERLAAKIIEFMENHPEHLQLCEQHAMNIILSNKWKSINPQWNRTMAFHYYTSWQDSPFDEPTFELLKDHPFVVHCTTKFKPWNSYNHPDKQLFYKYIDMTAWMGWRFSLWKAMKQKTSSLLRRK
jgi:lipopolysaccharide biosynthesis glycosyltransferase